MKPALPLLLAALLAAGAARTAAAQEGAPTPDEYGVWSALLDHEFTDSATTRLVVRDSTEPPWNQGTAGAEDAARFFRLRWRLYGLPESAALDEALTAFVAANGQSWPLEKRFRTRLPVQWLGSESGPQRPLPRDDEIAMGVTDAGLAGSSGIIRLSRVGFDRERKLAVVFVAHWCGPLCAEGKFVPFERQPDGSWKPMLPITIWVS